MHKDETNWGCVLVAIGIMALCAVVGACWLILHS